MKIFKCDRCQKIFEPIVGTNGNGENILIEPRISFKTDINDNSIPDFLDICPDCFDEFITYLNKYNVPSETEDEVETTAKEEEF